ncbi:unnamed protein product, partial [Closterium sp. NIES-53]
MNELESSGSARSSFTGGVSNFPLEILEDRQFERGFLVAAVPHLCAMLLAREGDPDALHIPTPRNHAEAVAGPYAPYWIAAEEAEIASYRSTGTYVNVVCGMWLYKLKLFVGSRIENDVRLLDHATGKLVAPKEPDPLGPSPSDEEEARFEKLQLAANRWAAQDDATVLAITDLLPLSKQQHFEQKVMAKGLFDAIIKRYSTPTTESLRRLVLPFLFPDLPSFHRVPGVSHVTPQSSPPQRPVPVVSGGAGGAAVEGEGTRAAGAGGAGFGGAWSVSAEPGGDPAGGTGGTEGVVGRGSGSGGAGARGMGTAMSTPCTVYFVTRVQCLDRGGATTTAGESRGGEEPLEQVQPLQKRVKEESCSQQARVEQESWPQQQTPEEAERLRRRNLPDRAPARFVRGPLPSPHVPPVESLSSSPWTCHSPRSRAVSPEPRRSRYRVDDPFYLVLRSRVPPPLVLPQPLES